MHGVSTCNHEQKLLRLCAFARKTTRHCEALRAIAHNVKLALKQSQHHYVAKF
jgi:hypothetical protein